MQHHGCIGRNLEIRNALLKAMEPLDELNNVWFDYMVSALFGSIVPGLLVLWGIIPLRSQRIICTSHCGFLDVECGVKGRVAGLIATVGPSISSSQAWAPFTEGRRRIFTDPTLVKVGERHGKTSAQVALRYLLQLGVAVVPKSSHRQRMAENLDVFDFELDAEDMARIGQLDEGRSLFGWY